MNQEDKLKEKYGADSHMKVPEGYFDSLNARIMQNLPAYPKKRTVPDMSLWQRLKPYVYLAAMFAGIWVMMKVFHTMTYDNTINFDNPPVAVLSLLDDNDNYNVYVMGSGEPEFILEDEVGESYDNIEDFERDFLAMN